ncbi:hypothetical protein KAR91_34480 [Candidatus Pacearchaeota archaeon]|nr:hypothetical protein [Candidatus Pacearchaeota archaeon]
MPDEFDYHSSASSFEEFLKSNIWRDIKYELNKWLEGIHLEMEDPDDDSHVHRLVGNAKTIRRVLLMPEVILDNIVAKSQESD